MKPSKPRKLVDALAEALGGKTLHRSTVSKMTVAVERFRQGFGADATTADVTDEAIEQFRQLLENEGKSPSTVSANYIVVIRKIAGRAQKFGSADASERRSSYPPELIRTAAEMMAAGKTKQQIAEALNVPFNSLQCWPQKHRKIWKAAYNAAMSNLCARVKVEAGTTAILENVDAFLDYGQRAQRWAKENGAELLPCSGKMSVRQFYQSHYKPVRLSDASSGTLKWHLIVIARWELITGNPSIEQVTAATLALFRDALAKSRGADKVGCMSPNTVRSYLATVQQFLDKAGPSGWRNRDALGLLDKVPWIKPPRKLYKIPKAATLDELGGMYQAACCMEHPQMGGNLKPSDYWRTLLVVAYNTGLRRGDLFRLRFADVLWDDCLLSVHAEKTKTGQEQLIHLNETTMAHLRAFRSDRELIFPPIAKSSKMFYFRLHELQKLAGIKPKSWGLHAIRKACATGLWEVSPQAAQLTLGHTTGQTTRQHYVERGGILTRALNQLPQPDAFTAGAKGGAA